MSFWNRILKFTKKKKEIKAIPPAAAPKAVIPKTVMSDKEQAKSDLEIAIVENHLKSTLRGLPTRGNYKFSATSKKRLATCHPDIQKVLKLAIRYIDFSVIQGTRSKALQDKYFAQGTSHVKYPNSYHNCLIEHVKEDLRPKGDLTKPCSLAVDVGPVPLHWNDIDSFVELARVIKICAKRLEVDLEWGPDIWNFKDYPHFQLTSYRKY